tara:strand:+ start:111 stop:1538 length:1428 start_codon:yes stop_codon:yes gene_type:complete
MLDKIKSKLTSFRESLFSTFHSRADATMELVDALSSNKDSKSVTQLSQNSHFTRSYNSINDVVNNFSNGGQEQETAIRQLTGQQVERDNRDFHLLGIDATPAPRKFSKTLEDRGFVYSPNVIAGNKPVTIGHSYSLLAYLPEKETDKYSPPWVLPLSINRIPTERSDLSIGMEQLDTILNDQDLPFSKELTVVVQDSKYGAPEVRKNESKYEDLVSITRARSNRVFNYPPLPESERYKHKTGAKLVYGDEMKLNDQSTWKEPDDTLDQIFISKKNKVFEVHIKAWDDIMMRTKNGIDLKDCPFTLLEITATDSNGNNFFKKPLWLIVSGKRRKELSLKDIYLSYRQRYDLEHFFRFGKQRLLLDKFQTPIVQHEENWWSISTLAYVQLFMARNLATVQPTPWEKYLPEMKSQEQIASPSQTQKSFGTITSDIGTPASMPKLRGRSLGRLKGAKQVKRERHPVIKKGTQPQKAQAA